MKPLNVATRDNVILSVILSQLITEYLDELEIIMLIQRHLIR